MGYPPQLQEVVRAGAERERHAVARARLASAQEMKAHYLSCLHAVVNTTPAVSAIPPATALEGGREEGSVEATVSSSRTSGAGRGRAGGQGRQEGPLVSQRVGSNRSTATSREKPSTQRSQRGSVCVRGRRTVATAASHQGQRSRSQKH